MKKAKGRAPFRFNSLFMRLQLVQAGLIVMFCLVIGSLVYTERNATLAGVQADQWAPHLADAAGLSASAEIPARHFPVERKDAPPPSAERPSLPAPRFAALRQALQLRGVAVQDMKVDGAGQPSRLWLQVGRPGLPSVWLGIDHREPVSPGALRLSLTGVSAALLLACASWVLTRRLTRPLETLSDRLQHHTAGHGGASPSAVPGWQATAPEILSIAKACSGLLARLQRHEREHAVLLKGLSTEFLGAPLERARRKALTLPAAAVDDASATSFLDEVVAAERLVGSLLDYVSTSELALDEEVDLVDAGRTVAARFAAAKRDVALSAPERLLWPQASRALVERMMICLVDNAFAHGRPPVRLEIGSATSCAWVTVEDAGEGLDPKKAQHLQEAFTRGEGNDRTGGGLGLAIVRLVATRLGGELSFERGEGVQKATVTLWTRPESADAA